jgi:methylmalonyl-CoA mutase N-terminal domain/subunit
VDPLGGSFYVESLTTAIEQQARGYLNRIDAMGGMVAAIECGWVQREIEDAAFRQQQAFDSGTSVVVGVNRFTAPDTTEPRERLEGTVEQDQMERVRALRMRRDPRRWRTALDRVTDQARCSNNLMPAILEAVESCATVGEIASSMGEVFGEYKPTSL